MTLCELTGKPVTNPVVSKSSGGIFEKAAIEEYILQNNQDPLNGEPLSELDLIEVNNDHTVASKSAPLQSIPSLLHTFGSEYDSLALENFELKKKLLETKKELSSTLYHHEAATKVVARLLKERDDARAAISRAKNES
ncbi:Prp19/Pso4-like-domain-containing protein [Lipomyces japonicus]|uniref:Prp19/Pso4-like-domain-containing protein n=1 Tax=Lipomyces japonicus TaxID=56871 RepID=UPI0034CFD117